MGSSNHVNIIGSVSNSKCGNAWFIFPDQSYNLLFLLRWNSATQNSSTIIGSFYDLGRNFGLKAVNQSLSGDNDRILVINLTIWILRTLNFHYNFIQSLNQLFFCDISRFILLTGSLNHVLNQISC